MGGGEGRRSGDGREVERKEGKRGWEKEGRQMGENRDVRVRRAVGGRCDTEESESRSQDLGDG